MGKKKRQKQDTATSGLESPVEAPEWCKACSGKVLVMCQRMTGFCSQRCQDKGPAQRVRATDGLSDPPVNWKASP